VADLHGANGYASEHEITLAPGAPVRVDQMQVQNPNSSSWQPLSITPWIRSANFVSTAS